MSIEKVVGPVQRAAIARGARHGFPGSVIFPDEQPPVTRYAANGRDIVVDWEATEAKYNGQEIIK